MNKDDEEVLVIPRRTVRRVLGEFQGFKRMAIRAIEEAIVDLLNNNSRATFLKRGVCETDPDWQQLIPYVIVHNVKNDNHFILQYDRSAASGDDRLKGNTSVGFGGHINREDRVAGNLYVAHLMLGLHRELDEELSYTSPTRLIQPVGFINDDSDPVGEVHLGIVFVLTICTDDIASPDDAIEQLTWRAADDIVKEYDPSIHDYYENWSSMVLSQCDYLCDTSG